MAQESTSPKKSKRSPTKTTEVGTLASRPLYNLDIEKVLLGTMLCSPHETIPQVVEIFGQNDSSVFYSDIHRIVFDTLVTMWSAHRNIDEVTLREELTSKGLGENVDVQQLIAECAAQVPIAFNAPEYAKIVLDYGLRRKLQEVGMQVCAMVQKLERPTSEILDEAEKAIFSVAEKRGGSTVYKMPDLIDNFFERVEMHRQDPSMGQGIPTGFADLDQYLNGLKRGDMIIIAARTSVGKTAIALNLAKNAAKMGKGVLIFSMEMTEDLITNRFIAMESGVEAYHVTSLNFPGKTFHDHIVPAAERLKNLPICVDNSNAVNVLQLRAIARRTARIHPVDLIIIDYLQYMREPSRSESRQIEVAEISRGIKQLAREMKVPVVVLSQLNRAADEAEVPRLSHLRDSGAIEQDADVVLLMTRAQPEGGNGSRNSDPNNVLVRINIAKNRNGPAGVDCYVLFQRHLQRFVNYSENPPVAPPPKSKPLQGNSVYPTPAKDVYTLDDEDEEVPF
jgi:replicative DNA helicase